MIRPPPRSTLFPYPTLSRSAPVGGDRDDPLGRHERVLLVLDRAGPADERQRLAAADVERADLDGCRGDRKSTRLNSSHGYISYAVFCLKKKNKQQEQPHKEQ